MRAGPTAFVRVPALAFPDEPFVFPSESASADTAASCNGEVRAALVRGHALSKQYGPWLFI